MVGNYIGHRLVNRNGSVEMLLCSYKVYMSFPEQFSLSLNIGYMLEEQISCPHRSLDFALAALIFGPKQDKAMVSVNIKHIIQDILFMQLHFKKYNLSFTIFSEK